ncbi:MAG: hypothetical protein AAB345_04545 [Patescibacteria group bacterium]
MADEPKFPFELPQADESPAQNPPAIRSAPIPPPVPPRAAAPVEPDVKIATGQGDFFSPETFEASPIPAGAKASGNLIKNIIIAVLAIVFVGGVGALSYFVVFPMLFPPKAPGTGIAPVVANPVTHTSYLVSAPAASANITLADHKYLTIATALQNESFNQLAEGQVKEVSISEKGTQVPFATFLASISPVTSALGDSGYFEKDFTALLYYDANGVWPIYVAKLKTGAYPDDLLANFKSLEGILDTANFYLASPGSFSVFKDGKVEGKATRYAIGVQPGAALNYGVLGDYFVIATNYNGLKAAMPLLGLVQPSSDK